MHTRKDSDYWAKSEAGLVWKCFSLRRKEGWSSMSTHDTKRSYWRDTPVFQNTGSDVDVEKFCQSNLWSTCLSSCSLTFPYRQSSLHLKGHLSEVIAQYSSSPFFVQNIERSYIEANLPIFNGSRLHWLRDQSHLNPKKYSPYILIMVRTQLPSVS